MEPNLTYLVCATHRSGSSLFCQSLWHTGLCGYPQEFFSPTQAEKISKEHELGVDPAADFPGYVKKLITARQSPNGVFGGKVMWAHLDPLKEQLNVESETDLIARLRDLLPNLQFFWAQRDDKVRQAISLWKAKQTNIYNSLQIGKRESPDTPPEYDFEGIRKIRDRFEGEDANWAAFFERNGIQPHEVHYEDFAPQHEEATLAVLRDLDISIPDDFEMLPLTYRKQSDALNDTWYERFKSDEAAISA
ncbi:MAG: Stf0 family sulfotransferase [Verrucomicrobiota bacterium]